MPEPFSEQQLAQLEERWRRDPGSRIFLQLAEELRRGGRLERAIEVLRAGLVRHPSYLSAQVALGRCLVERGDHRAAAEVLERAVAQDPAQLVASRLLIESHLALGDAASSRSRLDFYRLFSDRDDEIRALEARVRALESPAAAAALHADSAELDLEPFGTLREAASPALDFAPAAHRKARRDDRPFGPLAPPPAARERFLVACRREAIFAIAAAAPPAAAAASSRPTVEAAAPPAPPSPPVSLSEVSERPWWTVAAAAAPIPPAAEPERLAAPIPPIAPLTESESLPDLVAARPAPVPPGTPAPPWRDPAAALALSSEASLFTASFSPREIGAEVERETIEEPYDEVYSASVATPPAPAAAAASVTLAELYLEQGHLDEAERAFGAVLVGRPDDAAARQGLAEVSRRRKQLAAGGAESPWVAETPAPAIAAPLGSLSKRKAGALREYLGRLRRGASAHVP